MKVKYKNRCGICYFGKPMGEFRGTPICEECLSHRIVVTDEMRNRKQGTTPDRIDIPVMKSQSEWEWWQEQTRKAVFNALDAANERLNQLVWKEKRLKRALWLARAERADDRARIFYFGNIATILDIDGYSYDRRKKKGHKNLTAREWMITWLKVERKCRAKA